MSARICAYDQSFGDLPGCQVGLKLAEYRLLASRGNKRLRAHHASVSSVPGTYRFTGAPCPYFRLSSATGKVISGGARERQPACCSDPRLCTTKPYANQRRQGLALQRTRQPVLSTRQWFMYP